MEMNSTELDMMGRVGREEGSMGGDGRGLDKRDGTGLCEIRGNAMRQGATCYNGVGRDGTGWNRTRWNGTG